MFLDNQVAEHGAICYTKSAKQTYRRSQHEKDDLDHYAGDVSLDARTFTDGLLKERLSEQGIADYTIDTTAGGFITSDPIVYTVGYCYTHDGQTEVYGYKLSQSESGFDVIAEGTEIGEVVTGTGD